MRAVVLRSYGGPEVLGLEDVPDPKPGGDEAVVDVAASALNRADLMQRRGLYPQPGRRSEHEVPGIEIAGVVREVGSAVTMWRPGDRVMGVVSGGGYAERIAVPERLLMPVPAGVDVIEAAAIPEVFVTAWDALVLQGGLTPNRKALVHAGASGVGTAAIQLCGAAGSPVAVTASAGKLDACRELGADRAIERSPNDWLAELKAWAPDGVDVVLDVIGGEEAERNLAAVAPTGTVVQVGIMGAATATIPMGLLVSKRVRWIGTTLRGRPIEARMALARRFSSEVLPWFETGRLRPVIDSRFRLEQVADAHARMESNANVGKILLEIGAA